MEGQTAPIVNNNPPGLAVDSGAPIVAPAPPPPPPVQAAPPPAVPVNVNGTTPSAGVTPAGSPGMTGPELFKSVFTVENIVFMLGVAGLYWTISYYRYKVKEDRIAVYDHQRRMDKFDQRMGKIETAQLQSKATGNYQNQEAFG